MVPHDPTDPTLPETEAPTGFDGLPDRIGPYRIVRVLGEGGMGIVYAAEQMEPVMRLVALKVIRLGMQSHEVVARFQTERQALAVMDHPNIATVLDAGTLDAARPYFVMELVRGVPLNAYCDTNALSTAERLELFIPICEAVQHAHQKGVIHRDLKPSNVLIADQDGKRVPKVIDFGIAKAVGQRLTETTLVTATGFAIGTPAYMSPEQAEASGLDVDTRADIYSLGIMLYELLVGRLPVDPAEVGLPAFIAQLITRETRPPTPSARLRTLGPDRGMIAERRRTDVSGLTRELKGDLDWIVMRAMDKDRARRYETADAMANDLRRFLDHEPVTARPPSASYRLGKFMQRHKAGTAFGAALAVLVLAFAVTMTIQAGIVAQARDRAELEAAKARAVNEFMENTLLAPDPLEGLGRDVTVVEALGAAAAEVEQAFAGQPEVDAAARTAIGWAYFQMGRYDDAEPLLEQALAVRQTTLGPAHVDLAQSLHQWGRLKQVRAQFDSAEALYRRALSMRRALLGSEHPDVTASSKHLGILLSELGRYEEGRAALEEALAIEQRRGSDSLGIADLQTQIGVLLWNQGRYADAEPLWTEALATRRSRLGNTHALVAELLNNLAVLYDNTDRPDRAEPLYREALAIQRHRLGPDHEEVAAAAANLAILLDTKGEYGEAEQLYREALRIDRTQLGDEHPIVGSDLLNLGAFLCELGRTGEGIPLANDAVTTLTASLEPGHWRIGNAHNWRGHCYMKSGRFAAAERDLLTALDIMRSAFDPGHYRIAAVENRLRELYEAWGKPERAAAYREP